MVQDKALKIVLCGGGSGGHITPLLAVARELKKLNSDVRIVYIGEKNGKFSHIADDSDVFDERYYVPAGKLRRYHSESLIKQLLDVKSIALNIRDIFRVFSGVSKSIWLLRKIKPDAILLKGGFVCVPVAVAAHLNKIPYITHDSDALPGLSNRIAGKWAKIHATGMPAQYYKYPKDKVRAVGVPIGDEFRSYSPSELAEIKQRLGYKPTDLIMLVLGGSNGARRLNSAVVKILPSLLSSHKNLQVVQILGAGNNDQIENFPAHLKSRVTFLDFTNKLSDYSASADLVITRAGGTTMAEFAALGKACVMVPNPYLTGGHQLKNAQVYRDAHAALIVEENAIAGSAHELSEAVDSLLNDPKKRAELASSLAKTAPERGAAAELAKLLIEVAAK